jgi:hypothetical protein
LEKLSEAIISQGLTSPQGLPTLIPTYHQQQQIFENNNNMSFKKDIPQGMCLVLKGN